MNIVRLAGNLIAPWSIEVYLGHLQLVHVTDSGQVEIEVQMPPDGFSGMWDYRAIQNHADDNFFEINGKYAFTDIQLGVRSANDVWNLLVAIHNQFETKGLHIEYEINQNSNSYINTLLYVIGEDLSEYVNAAKPSSVISFPGVSTNVLDNPATAFGLDLSGTMGRDFIRGGIVADTLSGGADSDTLTGMGGSDLLSGGDGQDLIYGYGSVVGLHGDTLNGGSSIDIASYAELSEIFIKVIANDLAAKVFGWNGRSLIGPEIGDSLVSIEHILGTSGADVFISTNDTLIFEGGEGGDLYDLRGLPTTKVRIIEQANSSGRDIYVIPSDVTPDKYYREDQPSGGQQLKPNDGNGPPIPIPPGMEDVDPGGTGNNLPLSSYPPGPPQAPDDPPAEPPFGPGTGIPPVGAPLTGGGGFDPLVLDLNGDGRISLTTTADGVYFDFHGDGFAERSAWVGAEDGILVWDKNKNGLIEGFGELIASPKPLQIVLNENGGQSWDSEHGFAQLSSLDTNGDGIFSAKDDAFKRVRIWQDVDHDGVSDAGELRTLKQWRIKSIDIDGAVMEDTRPGFIRTIAGNTITHQSTFTMRNGSEREIVDAWLDHDTTNARYMENYTIDVRSLFLPTLRGYGTLPALYIAMSEDETLLTMVQTFVGARDFAQLFADFEGVRGDVEAILYRWADIDPTDHPTLDQIARGGTFEYMPEYRLLKKLTGLDNPVVGPWFAEQDALPMTFDGIKAVMQAMGATIASFTIRLLYQSGAEHLFADGASYNAIDDQFMGALRLSQAGVADLQAAAAASADKEGFWHNVAELLNASIGIGGLTPTERDWLSAAVTASSGGALRWNAIVGNLDETVERTIGNALRVEGTRWDDVITGAQKAGVTLLGRGGNDSLTGSWGDDRLEGGAGDDYLVGEDGDDVYVYDYGHDVIRESSFDNGSGTNILEFGSGILSSDISLKIARLSDWFTSQIIFEVRNRGTVTVETNGWDIFTVHEMIDYLRFADGTMIKFSNLNPVVVGSDNDDAMRPQGFRNVTTYFAMDGNDLIDAYGASGPQVVFGGRGNDTFYGGADGDTYVYDYGEDVFYEEVSPGRDIIRFARGIRPEDLSIERLTLSSLYGDENDVLITVAGRGSIFLGQQFDRDGRVDAIEFADGQIVELSGMAYANDQHGTRGSDTLTGADSHSYFLQDRLYSEEGNDYLDGGRGNDILVGGAGNDRYIVGNGFDCIEEGGGGTDRLVFDASYDLASFSYVVGLHNDYLDILYQDGPVARLWNQFSGTPWGVEFLEITGKATIDLFKMVYDQVGNDENNYMTEIYLNGSIHNRMFGLEGNDRLLSGYGNDFLEGGVGWDVLIGYFGDDTYSYLGTGYEGKDFIDDAGGNDVIRIGGAHTSAELTFSRSDINIYNLVIALSGIDLLEIEQHFSGQPIERIVFESGETVDLLSFRNLGGNERNNLLIGLDNTLLPADVISGYGGRDTLCGGEGDDTLYGDDADDELNGGIDDDSLEGGVGSDVYIYDMGMGRDMIRDVGGTADVLKLGDGLTRGAIIFKADAANPRDMLVRVNGQTLLTIRDQADRGSAIETVQFADGTTLDLASLSAARLDQDDLFAG